MITHQYAVPTVWLELRRLLQASTVLLQRPRWLELAQASHTYLVVWGPSCMRVSLRVTTPFSSLRLTHMLATVKGYLRQKSGFA